MLNEILRKSIHIYICLGCLYLVFAVGVQNSLLFFAIFLLSTFIYQKLGLLDRIIAVGRDSWGHYLITLGVLLTLFLHYFRANSIALVFAMSVLAFSDTAAALIGKYFSDKFKNLNFILINKKTLFGSLTFLIFTFVIALFLPQLQENLLKILVFGICLTLIEILSPLGLDNMTVPVAAYLLYDFT